MTSATDKQANGHFHVVSATGTWSCKLMFPFAARDDAEAYAAKLETDAQGLAIKVVPCGEVAETVRCRRCHRPLRTSAACAMGIGPRCAAIEAAFEGLDPRQQDKALEAIADGAVVRTSRPGIAQVVSDDGSAVYTASANGNCTCEWGVRRTSANVKTCWHPAAVRLDMAPRLTAARRSFVLAA